MPSSSLYRTASPYGRYKLREKEREKERNREKKREKEREQTDVHSGVCHHFYRTLSWSRPSPSLLQDLVQSPKPTHRPLQAIAPHHSSISPLFSVWSKKIPAPSSQVAPQETTRERRLLSALSNPSCATPVKIQATAAFCPVEVDDRDYFCSLKRSIQPLHALHSTVAADDLTDCKIKRRHDDIGALVELLILLEKRELKARWIIKHEASSLFYRLQNRERKERDVVLSKHVVFDDIFSLLHTSIHNSSVSNAAVENLSPGRDLTVTTEFPHILYESPSNIRGMNGVVMKEEEGEEEEEGEGEEVICPLSRFVMSVEEQQLCAFNEETAARQLIAIVEDGRWRQLLFGANQYMTYGGDVLIVRDNLREYAGIVKRNETGKLIAAEERSPQQKAYRECEELLSKTGIMHRVGIDSAISPNRLMGSEHISLLSVTVSLSVISRADEEERGGYEETILREASPKELVWNLEDDEWLQYEAVESIKESREVNNMHGYVNREGKSGDTMQIYICNQKKEPQQTILQQGDTTEVSNWNARSTIFYSQQEMMDIVALRIENLQREEEAKRRCISGTFNMEDEIYTPQFEYAVLKLSSAWRYPAHLKGGEAQERSSIYHLFGKELRLLQESAFTALVDNEQESRVAFEEALQLQYTQILVSLYLKRDFDLLLLGELKGRRRIESNQLNVWANLLLKESLEQPRLRGDMSDVRSIELEGRGAQLLFRRSGVSSAISLTAQSETITDSVDSSMHFTLISSEG